MVRHIDDLVKSRRISACMHTDVFDFVFGGIVLRSLHLPGRLTALVMFVCASKVASACKLTIYNMHD